MNIKRSYRFLALLIAFLLSTLSFVPADQAMAKGGISVPQRIRADTVWSAENGPYLISTDVVVEPGAYLVINAGIEVIFTGDYDLTIQGCLGVKGTERNPVRIHSRKAKQGELRLVSYGNGILYCQFQNLRTAVRFDNGSTSNSVEHCVMTNNKCDIFFTDDNNNMNSNLIDTKTRKIRNGSQDQTPSRYLRDIRLSAGYLNAAFDPKTTSYTVNLPENVVALSITPLKAYDGAEMTIDGGAITGKTINPIKGQTVTLTVKVTWKKTSTTYTLKITRAKSTNSLLSSLVPSAGTWSSPFMAKVYGYTLTLPAQTASVTFTASTVDPLSTVLINGILGNSATVSLDHNTKKSLRVIVISQSGAQGIYTVTVVRP